MAAIVRIRNNGEVTINPVKVYYYFTVEGGKTPICDDWDTPGCSVNLEHISCDNYRIVFDCSEMNLEPGDYFPNQYGLVVGLHYEDWSDWDRSNDYSHPGEESDYVEAYKIVVEESDGTVLWGEHPQEN